MNEPSLQVQNAWNRQYLRISERNTSLTLLAIILGSSFFCRMAPNSLQQAMQLGMGLDDNQVALVLGTAMAVPAVLGGIPVGLLADRYNRARMLSIFCLINILGTLATAFSTHLWMLVGARALVGFSTAAVSITVPSILADLFPPSRRGRGSMIYGVSQVVGMSAAFAAGGVLANIYAPSNMVRLGMLTMCVPLFLVFLLSVMLREQPRNEVAVDRPSLAASAAELWAYRGVFLPLLCGIAAIGVADGATLVWGVPTLSRSFNISIAYANSAMSIALFVGGLFGPVIGGFIADHSLKGGPVRALMVLALLAAFSGALGMFAVAPGALFASICLTAFLLTGAMIVAISLTLITVLFPNELRGFCTSVLSTAQILLSFGLAPGLVSFVAQKGGGAMGIGPALATVCSAASLICAVAFGVGRYYLARQIARSPQAGGVLPGANISGEQASDWTSEELVIDRRGSQMSRSDRAPR
jgi:MFS family permease